MAKKRREDPRQLEFNFTFEKKIDAYVDQKMEIQQAIHENPKPEPVENEFEACIEIAAAIKRAIRKWGGSRDTLVDEINKYFGRSKDGALAEPPECRKPLTINMMNNYLSKPVDAPIPVYYLFAIQAITGDLEPARILVEPEGAKIATGEEVRQMNLGKLEENITELQKLKRELKGKR